jgi:uncharacterized protein YqjF (DUF2071 family)
MRLASLLPKHPIAMRTTFRTCFLVNFAVDPLALREVLPKAIEPDLRGAEAFLSIVIAQLDRMRPAALPPALGVTYHQVVYRAVVRHRGERGVYFVRSDADNRMMCLAGDWLTYFKFHHSRMAFRPNGLRVHFDLEAGSGQHADIHATYEVGRGSRELPASSSFGSLANAQTFLVELFAAFGVSPANGRVDTVRIRRGRWDVLVVDDSRAQYEFMQAGRPFSRDTARLDCILFARDMSYHWYALARPPAH